MTSKIVGVDGQAVVESVKMLPAIKGFKPTGTRLLIELCTVQEMLGTTLELSAEMVPDSHQAYVLDAGPQYPDDFGVKVGDRVFIDGKITFAPILDSNAKKVGVIEYNMIKGVIVEE